MVLVVVTVAASVVVGWLRGGRLWNLNHLRLAGMWWLLLAGGAQLVLFAVTAAGGPAETLALPLLAVGQAGLIAFIWANRLLPGILLVLLGSVANATVIVVNRGMPVSAEALSAVSGGSSDFEPGKHRLLEAGDPLGWLADVIALPLLRTVVSLGDVVLAAGIGLLVSSLMLRVPRPHDPDTPAPHDPDTPAPPAGRGDGRAQVAKR
ncbi:MAG: DUF5317 domain-containing protein [Actinomycetota bacterium]|nr:DUF5317 domain-containing protein [Actinomycetota bacterium]